MISVYEATGKGLVAVADSPVSQMTLPVSSTDMLEDMVYVAELREHDARTSTAEGVTERLV